MDNPENVSGSYYIDQKVNRKFLEEQRMFPSDILPPADPEGKIIQRALYDDKKNLLDLTYLPTV